MKTKDENPTLTKAKLFARRIIKMYVFLSEKKHEYVLSKQILRSGTSVGANFAIIAPAMKYVDLPSLVGGAPRAPRNRFTPHFAVFRFRAARGAAPTNTPRINIFPRRIYKKVR